MNKSDSSKDKLNVVVTGASRGIGYETVMHFAAKYNCHILAISRTREKLDLLAAKCQQVNSQSEIEVLPFDFSNANIKDELHEQFRTRFQHIDILINNAGCLVNKPFMQLSSEDILKTYNVNVLSVYQVIQASLPLMEKSKRWAHIINISSMGGVQGSAKFAGLSAYSSSKGALAILTECLAEELGKLNVRTNCLALGAVQTEMLSEAFPGYKAPLSAKEMAQYIVDFSVNGSKYYNGKILPVSVSVP